MNNEELNEAILKIWDDFPKKRGEFYPILYHSPFKENSVLFVGMNPSFSPDIIKKVSKNLKIEDFKFSLPISENKKQKIMTFERDARNYRYFKDIENFFKDLSLKDNICWEHTDLFYFRAKNQKDLEKKVIQLNLDKSGLVNDFGRAQLNLSIDFIKRLNPLAIVVINANASKILKKEFGIDKNLGKDGFHRLNGIPIFFSSMLGGGHLDIDSRDRLGWMIRGALKNG